MISRAVRHFAAFWPIEITPEFVFVGIACCHSRQKQQKYYYLSHGVISPRQQEVGPVFRDSGSARPSAGLRFAERATRSRAPARFQKQDPVLTAGVRRA